MAERRILPLIILALAATLAGCGSITDIGAVEEPALIVFYGDTSDVQAPDTVARGVAFRVEVPTFAGGCTRQVARTDVGVAGALVEIRPWNRRNRGPACTDDLLHLMHVVELRLEEPGPRKIRIVGAQRGGSTGSVTAPATLERTIVVR